MGNDFNILDFAGLGNDKPWELQEPSPTDLRTVIEGGTPCSIEELGTYIASFVGKSIMVEEIEPPDSDVPWTLRVRVDGLPTDCLFWVEPLHEATKQACAVEAGWVLALQTQLHPDDPLTHFSNIMRLLSGISLPIHSICDIPTGRWFPKDSIEKVFLQDGIEPPEEVLWITRLIEAPEDGDPEDRWAWISTHGLTRCSRAELEMFGVPALLSTDAVNLIDGLAALTLETALPPAGQPIALGSTLLISLMKCNHALELLEDGMPGLEDHLTPSVAVVSPDGTKIFPENALQTLHEGETAMMKTLRSTNRQSLLARKDWGVFIHAVQQIGNSEHATCLVQVPWANNEDPNAPREYLWFKVVGVNSDTLIGELAHRPALVTSLEEGHREEIMQEDASDWVVMTPVGPLGPCDAAAIESFLDQFNN